MTNGSFVKDADYCRREYRMTNITIYDTEAKRLNEAAAKVGESVATVIEWLVEENLDELVDDVLGKEK